MPATYAAVWIHGSEKSTGNRTFGNLSIKHRLPTAIPGRFSEPPQYLIANAMGAACFPLEPFRLQLLHSWTHPLAGVPMRGLPLVWATSGGILIVSASCL